MPELDLLDDGWCFACGKQNPIGLRLEFEKRDGDYITRFTPGREHQGYAGITHGGLVATLLDEAMGRLVMIEGHRAVTAEMTVRLKRPSRTGDQLTVAGRITGEEGRTINTSAEARDSEGRVIAEGTARMVKVL